MTNIILSTGNLIELRVMKYSVVFIIGILLLSSCKKKLDERSQVLEGKWEWIYSVSYIYEYNGLWGNPYTNVDTAYPVNYKPTYHIEFDRKGCFRHYEDGEETYKSRMKSVSVDLVDIYQFMGPGQLDYSDPACRSFDIVLQKSQFISGEVLRDTMICMGTGLPLYEMQDRTYRHFFKRIN